MIDIGKYLFDPMYLFIYFRFRRFNSRIGFIETSSIFGNRITAGQLIGIMDYGETNLKVCSVFNFPSFILRFDTYLKNALGLLGFC